MSNAPNNWIHYDTERVDYSLTPSELDTLCSSANNCWKDFCIGCSAVGIPCMINGIAEISGQTTFSATLSIVLNLLLGAVGIVLGIAFGIAWYNSHTSMAKIKKTIQDKPKRRIVPPAAHNVGPIVAVGHPPDDPVA